MHKATLWPYVIGVTLSSRSSRYYYCVPTTILVAPAGIKLAGTEATTTPFDVSNTLLVV